MQGLLDGLSARIQPLDVPAAFSQMPALEAAAEAATLASADAASPSPVGRPQPQRSPLERVFEHISKSTAANPVGPLLVTPRPARTEREQQDLESRAAKLAAGVAPSSDDTAAQAAALLLRLFDSDADGAVSREELLSEVLQRQRAARLDKDGTVSQEELPSKATLEASDEPTAAKPNVGGEGPT